MPRLLRPSSGVLAALWLPLAVGGVLPDGTARHYHFVSPPPGIRTEPVPPTAQTFQIAVGPGGSPEREIATVDIQASLQLPVGAIEAAEGAEVVFTPFAPDDVPAPPEGYRVLGNVYRIEVRALPGGDGIERFARRVGLGLLYPPQLAPPADGPQPVIVGSADGSAWQPMRTVVGIGASFAQARISRPAWFAVAVRDPDANPAGSGFPWIAVVAVAALALIAVAVLALRRRRPADVPRDLG